MHVCVCIFNGAILCILACNLIFSINIASVSFHMIEFSLLISFLILKSICSFYFINPCWT